MGVPLAMVAGGVVAWITWSAPVGEGLIGGAACVALGAALLRFGFRGDLEREREEEARRYYDRHGRWPDEG